MTYLNLKSFVVQVCNQGAVQPIISCWEFSVVVVIIGDDYDEDDDDDDYDDDDDNDNDDDYHNDVPKRVPKRTEACFYFTISFVCPNHYVIVFGVQ